MEVRIGLMIGRQGWELHLVYHTNLTSSCWTGTRALGDFLRAPASSGFLATLHPWKWLRTEERRRNRIYAPGNYKEDSSSTVVIWIHFLDNGWIKSCPKSFGTFTSVPLFTIKTRARKKKQLARQTHLSSDSGRHLSTCLTSCLCLCPIYFLFLIVCACGSGTNLLKSMDNFKARGKIRAAG